MQTITPLSTEETLLASGVYTYFLNDQPTGIVEPWSIHRQPDDTVRTRVERDARSFGTTLLVEAVSAAPERLCRFHRFDVHFFNDRNEATKDVRAAYVFTDHYAQVTRRVNGDLRVEKIALPPRAVASPLMRVFLGPTILQVAAHAEAVPVLVPFLENPNDAARLLLPTFDQRRAQLLNEEQLEIAERTVATRCYQYLSRQYDEQSKFWINQEGLLVQYRFHQRDDQIWLTQLTEYCS